MSKITEAQAVLAALQLPSAQQTEIAALTLLVLAQLDDNTPWSDAKRQSLRIHDMMQTMSSRFGRVYAENTRETVRRQVIHQFEQARLVDRNPDEPGLATQIVYGGCDHDTAKFYSDASGTAKVDANPDPHEGSRFHFWLVDVSPAYFLRHFPNIKIRQSVPIRIFLWKRQMM